MTVYKGLVALSAFKGTLSAREATRIVSEALLWLGFEAEEFPIADGGYGTLALLKNKRGGEEEIIPTVDPLFRPRMASVLCFPNRESPTSVFVESTEACGFSLVSPSPQTALMASSFGLGQLISKITDRWASSLERIYVTLGDSSVSDGGLGMLQALGGEAISAGRRLPPEQMPLFRVEELSWRGYKGPSITVLCDVQNPLCGPQGSVQFAPQKGVAAAQLAELESRFLVLADLIAQCTEKNISDLPYGGSAGGLGAAFYAFTDAELVSGARFLLDFTGFSKALAGTDFVVTGEGKTDAQTLKGKAVFEVLKAAEERKKKSILLSGQLGKGVKSSALPSLVAAFACDPADTPENSLKKTALRIFSDDRFVDLIDG